MLKEDSSVNVPIVSEHGGSGIFNWGEGFGEWKGVACVVEDVNGIDINRGLCQGDRVMLRSIVVDNYLRKSGSVLRPTDVCG